MNPFKDKPMAPIFGQRAAPHIPPSSIPSSSPAFGTPIHPLRPFARVAAAPGGAPAHKPAAVLPILLPPATLRPLAFRTFTKKHSLTLTSSALQELAAFVGRHCGSGWREEGLADRVLEEAARAWKARNGGVIVDGASKELADILKALEGNMSGGKVAAVGPGAARGGLSRQGSLVLEPGQEAEMSNTRLGLRPPVPSLMRQDSGTSFGMSGLDVEDDMADDDEGGDVRKWLKVVDAFEQPRMVYNVAKKHFERDTSKPSLMPPASHKTLVFRNRYNVIHQRLLRNESFQTSAVASARSHAQGPKRSSLSSDASQGFKLTPISNLLGRHGSHHMLLGMLTILPSTGGLAFSDPSGTIALDVSHAVAVPDGDAAWFCPGMIVLVDGVYEEDEDGSAGRGLGATTGIGGVLGGRFQAFFMGQPPCERRKVTLDTRSEDDGHTIGGGFGWIDFLGVGSERAVGSRMRRLEQRILRRSHHPNPHHHHDRQHPERSGGESPGRVVIIGELNLDNPRTLQALCKILSTYAEELSPDGSGPGHDPAAPPISFVLTGNFTTHAVLARGGNAGSIEYKEAFDALASTLAEFPALLRAATFIFVPGDNDGWVSAFTAGAAVPLPRKGVPDMFTSRIRRTFAAANAEGPRRGDGEAVWTTNPSRISLFGPAHEIVLFRDDVSARLRRTAVRLGRRRRSNDDDDTDGDAEMAASDGPNHNATSNAESMDLDDDNNNNNNHNNNNNDSKTSPPKPPLSQDVRASRRLVKTLLDQGFLAPFRQATRPVHWDFAGALHLYPLPTAAVVVDTTAPTFCVTYEGCHVMNPGAVLVAGRRGVGRWVEWTLGGTGVVRECTF